MCSFNSRFKQRLRNLNQISEVVAVATTRVLAVIKVATIVTIVRGVAKALKFVVHWLAKVVMGVVAGSRFVWGLNFGSIRCPESQSYSRKTSSEAHCSHSRHYWMGQASIATSSINHFEGWAH